MPSTQIYPKKFKNNRITRNPIILKNIGISLYIHPYQSQTTVKIWHCTSYKCVSVVLIYKSKCSVCRERTWQSHAVRLRSRRQRTHTQGNARRRKRLLGRVNRGDSVCFSRRKSTSRRMRGTKCSVSSPAYFLCTNDNSILITLLTLLS